MIITPELCITITNMIVLAIAVMLKGSGKISHTHYFSFITGFIGGYHFSNDWAWLDCAALLSIIAGLTLLPTNGLMTCIHGILPGREDGRWQWMQDITTAILIAITPHNLGAIPRWEIFLWGVIYGAVRASLILVPALYIFGGWGLLILLHGLLYFLCGRISGKYGVRIAEGITGAMVGTA